MGACRSRSLVRRPGDTSFPLGPCQRVPKFASPFAVTTHRSMSGNNAGVRNLRAMFESQNAASSSPEPRGRSPAGSATSDANRPTSKVRASFVSVEPHAAGAAKELGTTKGVSTNTPHAQRRESFSVSGESSDVADLKQAISEEKEERKKSIAVDEAVPEQAVETRESSRAPAPLREPAGKMPNLGSIMKGSDFPEPVAAAEQPTEEAPNVRPGDAQVAPAAHEKPAETQPETPDKVVTGAQEEAALKPADPTDEAAVAGGGALPAPAEVLSHPTSSEAAPQTPKITEPTAEAKETPRTNGRASTRKPAAISTAKSPARSARGTSAARSPLPKSPLPKTPTASKPTPAATAAKSPAPPAKSPAAAKSPAPAKAQLKPAAPREPTKPVAPKFTARAPAKPSTATAGTTATAAAKAKPAAAEIKKISTKAAPSAPSKTGTATTGGFVKPKPRSPTRPVRLPSHLTAPTASSAAKHGEEAAEQKPARKPSTVPRPAPKAAAPAAKKPAPRASLAPSTARPASRASTAAGASDGFLARMMRPTASSASKTHDKPESPPRQRTTAKATTKPKAPEGLATKAKKKVEEVAAKAKDVVTNGNHEERHEEKTEEPETATTGPAATEPIAEKGTDIGTAPVPTEDTAAGAEEPVSDMPTATEAEKTEHAAVESESPKAQEEAVF
ncbi:uncharacterized protein CC84DRAFT_489393 [Paraphaeosphaeria sporulosa]|uniref:Mucin-7 n=1 Tax=Paraphaeosphaeria sporulosa TaxID=1460663 RepID=A0A177CTF4_9PLEO|nr:uncharacterized protein CC84DRAFT_489393 [Paraphaeosphaeria sporulosa]OAG10566.1 hypothetical protein CC84DRAFT_489393 [Paraphaeosphaeria sporulosa]